MFDCLGSLGCDFLRELETDSAVFRFQIRREWPAAFGDKAVEQVGFSGGEKLLRLFFRNLAAQDRFCSA